MEKMGKSIEGKNGDTLPIVQMKMLNPRQVPRLPSWWQACWLHLGALLHSHPWVRTGANCRVADGYIHLIFFLGTSLPPGCWVTGHLMTSAPLQGNGGKMAWINGV